MSRSSRIPQAAARLRAAAFCIIALLAAVGRHPAQARIPLSGIVAGATAPGLPPVAVVAGPGQNEVRVHSADVLVSTL